MSRIQQRLCVLAWRILWRWWPDRVYMAATEEFNPRDPRKTWIITEAGTPSHPDMHVINNAFLVWEKIDHPGRLVKQRG